MKYSKGCHRRGTHPLSNTSLPIFRTENIHPGRVPERESGSTCLVMGLPLTCNMSLDRHRFVPFSSSPVLCPLYFYSKILREETRSVSVRSLKTACTMLVHFNPAPVSQKVLERQHTPQYCLHFTELNTKLSMKWRYARWREKYGQG